jgi:ABC-type multidrug transport system ATPase subunit
MANPSIVFCDEPTSGLDAGGVAKQGRSIHQPSTGI